MLSAVLTRLGRLRVTLIYAVALAAVAMALVDLGPRFQEKVVRYASTNVHNLEQGRIGTLIGSAFVNEAGPIYLWLPGLVALLALGELLWESHRLVIAFVVGHVGATLIVAAGLAAAIASGVLSRSVAYAADVGMSYGAVAVLGTITAAIPFRWRAAWAGWWLAVAISSTVLSGGEFTNAGHTVALILGMVIGSRFAQPVNWTLTRYVLLVVGAGFGYLILAYSDLSTHRVAACGVAGAVIAWAGWRLVRWRSGQTNSSAEASIQSDSQVSGGLSSNSPGISHS
ncbi:MAG: rhomboid-like protein [Mycobacterium sp.]|jgi:hypothetical protein